MNWFQKFFSGKEEGAINPIKVDIHSHLLPGIDDGVEKFTEALEMVKKFSELGYKKLITTPHIMGDFYKNTPLGINEKLQELKRLVAESKIEIVLEACAEYYLDEWLVASLKKSEPLLSFGDSKYVLFETSYINEPAQLHETIFLMKAIGYKPILAHPERYTYLYSDFERYEEIKEKGVLFQLNTNSISGYYSPTAQKFAEKLIDNNMVDFIGSDCHGIRHMNALEKSMKSRIYSKLLKLDLLNNTLLQ